MSAMKRFEQYVGTLAAVVLIWLGLELQRASFSMPILVQALHLCPLLAVLVFGVACLCKLVFDISTFNDYSAGEIPALGRDIEEAKADLRARRFVD